LPDFIVVALPFSKLKIISLEVPEEKNPGPSFIP
jgi:hypothetical protein